LVVASVASGVVAVRADAETLPRAIDAPQPSTPVLAARRAPEALAAPLGRRRLESDLEGLLARSPANTCLAVADGDDVLFSHRDDAPVVPASTFKMLTAAAALKVLGPDTTFQTRAAAMEPPVDGVLRGELFLIGGGDPILATPGYAARYENQPQTFTDFEALADAIKATGIVRIEGGIVGDESRYDKDRYLDAWPQRYIDQDQTGPLSALTVNDGFARFPVTGTDSSLVDPAVDPAVHAAGVLTFALAVRGVAVTGPVTTGVAPEGVTTLASVTSPPLEDVVAEMLRESDNVTAELLLKELGFVRAGQGTSAAGAVAMESALRALELPLEGVAIVDGSGLATQDNVTCASLMGLLGHDELGEVIEGLLPVAGRTGTLRKRFVGSPVAGRLRAKTGSLNQVTSLAGVLDPLQGGELTFAYVANVPDRISGETVALQDELALILLGYPRGIDLSRLGPEPPRR
jgi:D-alanyl-D-alanine carboxypeptidase/D-alanyl-D-alanine-endopeptidase (penicillin-binding protein 4)